MYWAVDLHGTLILPNYAKMKAEDVVYYPHAMEAMRLLTRRPDVRLIMYTCSWPAEVAEYQKRFMVDGINFDWINENPDVNHTEYGYYQDKPYFNVLLDDKAGFDPWTGWKDLMIAMVSTPGLDNRLKLWLDDEREAPDGWVHCRWPIEVISAIGKTAHVGEISLDHDLGDDETGTGYDVLTWIEKSLVEGTLDVSLVPNISIHTANPVARQRMEQAKEKIEQLRSRLISSVYEVRHI